MAGDPPHVGAPGALSLLVIAHQASAPQSVYRDGTREQAWVMQFVASPQLSLTSCDTRWYLSFAGGQTPQNIVSPMGCVLSGGLQNSYVHVFLSIF